MYTTVQYCIVQTTSTQASDVTYTGYDLKFNCLTLNYPFQYLTNSTAKIPGMETKTITTLLQC